MIYFIIALLIEFLIINYMKLYPFNYQLFSKYLANRESSNNYQAQNLIANGKYQFTVPTINQIASELNIVAPDVNTFLNSPSLQEAFFVKYVSDILKQIIDLNLLQYLGQQMNGQVIDIYGLVAGAWLGGVGGLKNELVNNSETPDYLGTNISDYIALFSSYKISNV